MKNITLFTTILTLGLLLSGCGDSPNTRRTATAPGEKDRLSGVTVHLKAQDKGNISYIDFSVTLPSNTKENLLDYNGEVTIRGTIDSTALPCLKGRKSFNCKAQLSVGNITANNCSINNNSISLLIVLFRGEKTKESYTIKNIIAEAPLSCHYPQN